MQDLRVAIETYVKQMQIKAGYVITAVGSLQQACIRLASAQSVANVSEKFEIVSLIGTLSLEGIHLHIALANDRGKTIGGHVLAGCIVYTTVELVLGEALNCGFHRAYDEKTGYKELSISEECKP